MIVNGSSNRCVAWWTQHLQSEVNEKFRVVESHGLRAGDINGMLQEMTDLAQGTRCQNPFYQINFSPAPGELLTPEQWDHVRETLEKQHGFEGQPYFMVMHTKHGEEHPHYIYFRVNLETGKTISDSYDARKNHAIARTVEWELGLQKVVGPYDREPDAARPTRAPKRWEMSRGLKTGIDPRDVAAEVTALFRQSKTGTEFKAALEQRGYQLATGARAWLILDAAGKEHSLARRCAITTKELKAFMADIDMAALPTVEEAKPRRKQPAMTAIDTPALPMPAIEPGARRPPDGVEDDHQTGITGLEPQERQQGKEKQLADDMATEQEPLTPLIVAAVMRPATETVPTGEKDHPAAVPAHADDGSTGARRSFTGCIRQLFRVVKEALTCKPKPRRRRTEETRSAFKLTRQLLPRLVRMPILPVYQTELWQWNNPDVGCQTTEEFSIAPQNPLSPQP